ncbi:trypsin-like peptidase domain-containing protein [Zavarzinia sp.]|uniref:trypsin-like peptidase domain-containing protein n=1 Tax=Zavarzinia sp. TaxID=2027920 RepID=UPI0035674D8A
MAIHLRRATAALAAFIVAFGAVPVSADDSKGSLRPSRPRPEAPATPPASGGSIEGDDSNGFTDIAQGRDPRLLQLSLIWAGFYTGIASGQMDSATASAVKAFQKSIGARVTGQLTDDQFVQLLRGAAAARAKVGWTAYTNQDKGFRVDYPAVLLTKTKPGDNGGRILSSADGSRRLEIEILDPMNDAQFKTLYDTVRGLQDGQKRVTQAQQTATGFTYEGADGATRYSGRVERRVNGIVGVTYFYPTADAASNAGLVAAIMSEFDVPDPLGPPEAPPADAEMGVYAKNEAQVGSTEGGSDSAEATPDEPRAPPSRPDQRPQPQRPPQADGGIDQVSLPTLPMPVATQTLDPAGVFQKVKDAVWVVVAAPMRNGQPYLEDGYSQGSAVAVTAQHLFTNCHVLEGQEFFGIFRSDDMSDLRPVTVKLRDVDGDRCILRVDKPDLPTFVSIRSHSDVAVGERAYTIGAPSGLDLTLGEGLVSGKRRHEGQQYVQTSAPISPGSSGGGLFDARGNLIGITTFMLRDTQNLNFAIAAEEFLRPGASAGAQ